MSNLLVAGQTSAATATLHITQDDLPIGVSAGNLGAADTVTIEIEINNSFEPTGEILESGLPKKSITDSGTYRLNKSVTTNAVSLNYDGVLQKSQIDVS